MISGGSCIRERIETNDKLICEILRRAEGTAVDAVLYEFSDAVDNKTVSRESIEWS